LSEKLSRPIRNVIKLIFFGLIIKGAEMNRKSRHKNIYLLGGSSLFNDIGSEMITPILPFYITALGGTGIAVGALSGLREGFSSLFKILGGWISDIHGKRKNFVFLGYLISIISRFLLFLANSWQAILMFISLERFGKLRDPPRDAIIIESTHHRGKWFGIHQMMDTSGGIIGTFLVLILFWKLNLDFKSIIFIAALISAISLIPLIFVKEIKTKPVKRGLLEGIHKLDKKLKYFIFVTSVFTLGNFGLYMFMLMMAKQITNSTLIPLALYILFNLCFALFVIPFGRLSDKIGRKKILILGYVLFFGVALFLLFCNNLLGLIILFAAYGLVYAITNSNQKALASDLSGDMKGTAMGFFHSVIGIVNIPAGIIAGILWDINPRVMFWYISAIALISVIFLLFVKENGEYKK